MTVDNSFTMKKFQSMEIIYVTFSQITKLPYVECDPETFDDQVYMFTEEEAAKEFAKSYVEKNTPLLTVKVLRKQMPNFYMGLYAEGVNMVIFHEGDQTRRIELEQIFPKPDMEKMNKQHLPVLNPGVQLTVVYFLQELRKPNQRRDDAERMQHLRELEEEMLVNLMRSKFILAIDISQVQGEFDPANPGPDVRIPYIKNQNEDIFQPLFSDIGEFQKFRQDPVPAPSAVPDETGQRLRHQPVRLQPSVDQRTAPENHGSPGAECPPESRGDDGTGCRSSGAEKCAEQCCK